MPQHAPLKRARTQPTAVGYLNADGSGRTEETITGT